MQSSSLVDVADRKSRKRAWVAGAAAAVFLLNVVLRPTLTGDIASHTGVDWWAVNAIIVLLVLATGGGVFLKRDIRDLMNDEISKMHLRTSLIIGYWVAMTTALGIYLLPRFRDLPARLAVYGIVSASAGLALLAFSVFEIRSHRDG